MAGERNPLSDRALHLIDEGRDELSLVAWSLSFSANFDHRKWPNEPVLAWSERSPNLRATGWPNFFVFLGSLIISAVGGARK